MFDKGRVSSLSITILSLIGIACADGAAASEACQGSYTTALLQPLPSKVVVDLDIHDRSPRNLDLAEQFRAGVRDAGVAVGTQPNVLLHVSVSRIGETPNETSGSRAPRYSEFSGLQGGQQPALPDLPTKGLIAPRPSPSPPLLFIRVDATVGNSTRISWVATAQCQMKGTDEGQLAEDLGRVVGNTLGKRTERRPF